MMMETGILAKALAVLLTLGQLQDPQNIKMNFDKVQDRGQAVQIMNSSCVRLMTKFKDVSGIDITKVGKKKEGVTEEDSVVSALTELVDNAKNKNATTEIIKGLDVKVIKDIYLQICKGQTLAVSAAPVDEAIEFYNKAVMDLPSDQQLIDLKNKKLSQSSLMMDGSGEYFSDIYKSQGRRHVIDFSSIPEHVKKAFTSIEDHRFYEHNGIDELGLLRAFFKNIISGGRPEGASTITQQVIKNLVVGDDITFERKIREMILAVRLDQGKILSKDEILALYLNYIYLGRSSWGVEMAAQSYFGKSIRDVSLAEAAFLAGLTHSPNKYTFTVDNKLALNRRNEVLSAIKKFGKLEAQSAITPELLTEAESAPLETIAPKNPRSKTALYFADDLRLY
ncbi:MAG: transglycosylase domain-containing protein, partial [Bdellovibrionaceae bacterium]|nr:transglycosylase domain-containing protein [Pseudobdellovibrionaceae bacterium]